MRGTREGRETEGTRALAEIFRVAKEGTQSVLLLLPHTSDGALRSIMTQQLDGYEGIAKRAGQELARLGAQTREDGALSRALAKAKTELRMMGRTDNSLVAELLIGSTHTGIAATTRLLRSGDTDKGATALAEQLVQFEQDNVRALLGCL